VWWQVMIDNMATRLSAKPVVVEVVQEYHIVGAQRKARTLALEMGMDRTTAFYVATCVSELANNLFFHAAGGGTITLTPVRRNGQRGIEVIAEDDGPGIPRLELAMQDGFSTSGGLGGGLPGAKRLMDEFEIASTVGDGTRVVARKWIR